MLLWATQTINYFLELLVELIVSAVIGFFLQSQKVFLQSFDHKFGVALGNPSFLVIVKRLVQWYEALDIVVTEWDLDLQFLERGHVHDILDDSESGIVSVCVNIEVFSVGGKIGTDGQNDWISENTLWLEFAFLVWVYSVEFSEVFIYSEVSDSHTKDLQSGINWLKIFKWSCVCLGLGEIWEIDDFDLDKKGMVHHFLHRGRRVRFRVLRWMRNKLFRELWLVLWVCCGRRYRGFVMGLQGWL